jgi:predicted nuclease of restriction endonuclease-like (RecB) superfamily
MAKARVPAKTVKAPGALMRELRSLIRETRAGVARAVNSALVTLYWEVGSRIRQEILQNTRAEYGKGILNALGRQLTQEFGTGFGERNLAYMVRFAEVYPDVRILHALRAKLSWTHFRSIIYLDDPLKRDFYAEMCRVECWSTRTLEKKIAGMLFERTALSPKPAKLARQELTALRAEDKLSPELVFRDPYFLDFLGLKDTYSEDDLEAAILRELEAFLLELGAGFTFAGRQVRITVDADDYYLDLLFFHRKLRRLVAIDLKLGKFTAADKGQMELYLRWLEKYEMQSGEEAPIGLILCAGKSDEQIELLQLDKSGIRVAAYLTELPPRRLLKKKLHAAIAAARARLEHRTGEERDG